MPCAPVLADRVAGPPPNDVSASPLPPGEIRWLPAAGHLELSAWVYRPPALRVPAPVIVSVHGISRNAREQVLAFAPGAERHGFAVVAPHFEEGVHGDYQRLGRRGRGPRADVALDRVLAALAGRGLVSEELFLFGYSGGGQFVHRYAMAHPERVRAAAVAAAGWYTWPDSRRAYPHGLRVDGALPGVRFRPRAFLRVPMLVAVGSRDRERDDSLRRSVRVDRHQGRDRVARARHWVRAMREAAASRGLAERIELVTLRGAAHSFGECAEAGLVERVLGFFESVRAPAQEDA